MSLPAATSQPTDDAPVVEPVPPSADAATTAPKQFMGLDTLSADISMEGRLERREVRTRYGGWLDRPYNQTNRRQLLQESIGLQSTGWFADPRTLTYDAMFRGGLSQEQYDESVPGPDRHNDPNGEVLQYDLRLTALPAGKVSASAFASQLDDRIPRPFLPSLNRRRNRWGAQINYNDAKLPMQLSYEHLEDDLNSGVRRLQDREHYEEDHLRYEATWQPTDNHSLRLDYENEQRHDRYSGTDTTFDTQRNFFSLTDVVQFGDQHKHRFETYARIEDESGDLARDAYEITPQLRLQHTDNFFSTYRAQYLKENFQNLDTTQYRGDVGLTHQWRQMLTSSLNIYALKQELDKNADVSEWGPQGDLAFVKDNSLGRLSSNLSYAHTEYRTEDGGRRGVVIGESLTFRDPLPAMLARPDVDRLAIIVTDAARRRAYLLGRDYLIVPMGRYTGLVRVPTGQLADRQSVQVNYTYRYYRDFALSRDRADFRIQQDFKNGITPYFASSLQYEDASREQYQTWRDRDVVRERVGVTYRQKKWSTGIEYEYNDDSIDPYQAVHLNGDVVLLQKAAHDLSGRATLSRFAFRGTPDLDDRDSTLLDLGMNYRYQMSTRLEANAAAMYRYQTDSYFGRTQGVDLTASVGYKIGQFTVLFEAEYDRLDLPRSDENSTGLWIKLRRDIPIYDRKK